MQRPPLTLDHVSRVVLFLPDSASGQRFALHIHHVLYHFGAHFFGVLFLSSDVGDDISLSVARYDVDVDLLLLPKAPATSNSLVVLFPRVGESDKCHLVTVLP